MYIGYTDRRIYVENRKRKAWRGIALFLVAFILGCATMQVTAWEGAPKKEVLLTREVAPEKEGVPDKETAVKVEATELMEAVVLTENVESVKTKSTVSDGDSGELPVAPSSDTKLILLDPGHGGEDEGCSNKQTLEKDINLQLAFLLRDKLSQMDYEVLLTREADTYLSVDDRVALANGSNASLLVSIHQNAFEEKEAAGIETWYCNEESKRLAQLLHKELILATGAEDRGTRESGELKLIRESHMPCCLVETGFLSNKEEAAKLTDASYQESIVEGLASAIDLYFNPKTMYLTFDDGPTAESTVAILDTLKEHDVKATFFVIGENVEQNPAVARRIVEEGHTIGIHCNSHDYNTIYASADSYVADFEAAYEIVKEVTGVEAQLFRFPGGSVNAYNKKVYTEIIETMTEKGFVYFDWNASLEDASRNNDVETILRNAKESTLGRKKVVMLAHDRVHNTASCLEDLLEQFPEYCMEPLTTEVEPIQF